MRRKGTNEQLAIVRKHGLSLLHQGRSARDVAEALQVTRQSVYRWQRETKKRTLKKTSCRLGRPRKITNKQFEKLEKSLDQGASAYGYVGNYWTLARIAQLIWQLFKVRYHPSAVWHVLDRMNWSSQRPQRRALHRDEEAIVKWKKKVLPRIKKDTRTQRYAGT